jgi:ABC-type multidrug transport system fused ATPase/permease subunit
MDEVEGEAASTRQTLRYCVDLCRPYSRYLLTAACLLVVGVVITDVATPLVFAEVLDRIAVLSPHTHLWGRFGSLIVAYGVLIVAGQAMFRFSGWLQWEGSLRSFANGIHRSFERLLALGYRWHVDHPSGEVASSLSSFSWAFVDGLDNLHWGVLRTVVVVLCAIVVLAVYAWPVTAVLIVLTAAFVLVVVKRSAPVTEASRMFSKDHSRAEGTASDVIRNVSTVLVGAGRKPSRPTCTTSWTPRCVPTCRAGGCS